MGNSLSERIATEQIERKVSDKSVNKAAFLALKKDIASALADGCSIKFVWGTLVALWMTDIAVKIRLT